MPKTDPIDISSPASTSSPKQGDDTIRKLARAVIEILSKDHYVGTANANSQYDEDAAGEHAKVTLNAPLEADPAPGANKGALYIKDVGGVAELFFQDEVDNPVQLTTGGKLNAAALGALPADTYLTAVDTATGESTVNLIKASADDVPVLAAGAELAAAINDEAEDLAIPDKKYVDDQIAAETTANAPAMCKAWLRWTVSGITYTIQDSYNVESLVRNAVGQLTVTFTTPFANANYAVAGTVELERHLINDMVRTPSTYKFRIRFGTDTMRDSDSSGSLIFMGTQ